MGTNFFIVFSEKERDIERTLFYLEPKTENHYTVFVNCGKYGFTVTDFMKEVSSCCFVFVFLIYGIECTLLSLCKWELRDNSMWILCFLWRKNLSWVWTYAIFMSLRNNENSTLLGFWNRSHCSQYQEFKKNWIVDKLIFFNQSSTSY